MIKDRIPPSLIKGLIVKSQAMKTKLIDHLRKAKLVEKSSTGVETLLGVPVNQFVQCVTKMSEVKV